MGRELSSDDRIDDAIDDRFDWLDMHLDVPFVPTDERVVRAMLDMAAVDAGDVLYDLGSGDGRIVVAAARDRGAQAVGVEMDSQRVTEAEAYADRSGVGHMVSFIEYDLFFADFSPATVVTMYLLHTVNLELRPRLLDELRPGTRIVSHAFDMGDWKPDRRMSAGGVSIFLWIVPAKVAGTWRWKTAQGLSYRVRLEQTYQRVSGQVWVDDAPAELQAAVLWGDWLELVVKPDGAGAAESIFMQCHDDHWVAASGSQKGAIVRRVAE